MSHLTGPEESDTETWKVVAFIVIFFVLLIGLEGGGFFYDLGVWILALLGFGVLVVGVVTLVGRLIRASVRK